ncbi:hypothetical protein [Actinoplanes sp. NPDC049316]|uniref:hypothetical protein n=1 Tax=Actinoplanes sp. NPDC049316 TaxID=3154727 RepID=UPI00341FA525
MNLTADVADLIRGWQLVDEQHAIDDARRELADARTLLAALEGRPDWDRQPDQISRARALIEELTEKARAADEAAAAARTVRRRAMYPAAAAQLDSTAEDLAAEAMTLTGRAAEITAGLAELIEALKSHLGRSETLVAQRRALDSLAAQYGEQDALPGSSSTVIPPVPRGNAADAKIDLLALIVEP